MQISSQGHTHAHMHMHTRTILDSTSVGSQPPQAHREGVDLDPVLHNLQAVLSPESSAGRKQLKSSSLL